MSDKKPTITVTRGTKRRGPKRRSSSAGRSNSWSGFGLPNPMDALSSVMRGVRTVWWAGLGLLSVAEEASLKVFDALVEQGKSWRRVRRRQTEATARTVRRLVEEVPGIDAVERRVRDGLDRALYYAGAPQRDDFERLRAEVDALNRTVERLAQSVEEERGKDPR